LIGLARLYLGVHYFTDVAAGYLAGFFWTDAIVISGRLLTRRRAQRQSQLSAPPPRDAGRIGRSVTASGSG
jgi:hypothetical protein